MADIQRVAFYGGTNYGNEFPIISISSAPQVNDTILIYQWVSCTTPGSITQGSWTFNAGTAETITALGSGIETFNNHTYVRGRWFIIKAVGTSDAKTIQGSWSGGGSYFTHQLNAWVLRGCNNTTQNGANGVGYGTSGQSRTAALSQVENSSTMLGVCWDFTTAATLGSFFTALETMTATGLNQVGGYKMNVGDTKAMRNLTFGGTSADDWGVHGIEVINANPAGGGGFAPRAARSNQMAL